jgi:UDP-N-acetylglucosamine 4-epimerase
MRKTVASGNSQTHAEVARSRHVWLVTGGAGFIGSHLVEALLELGQSVLTLDNFSTGYAANLEHVRERIAPEAWHRHRLLHGDIRDLETCRNACHGVDYVLHNAALGSVPRSIADPLEAHAVNVTGFLNMLVAARDAKVKRFIYAASSASYGDHPGLPKVEDQVGHPLSPYAAAKYANELYADVFHRCYDMDTVGLRYFNVFGARQDPQGPYAAVIPRWIQAMLTGQAVQIYGDGETTRDFCYVTNVVQANLLAASTSSPAALNQIYNVAVGSRTSLNQLFHMLRELLAPLAAHVGEIRPEYRDFRPGDVRHSLADISRAKTLLGYEPSHGVRAGLEEALGWYVGRLLPSLRPRAEATG